MTLRRDFADWLQIVPSAAGLHLCARLTPGAAVDLEELRLRAQRAGVAVQTLAAFCGGERPQPGLVLGYGSIQQDQIADGLRLLSASRPSGGSVVDEPVHCGQAPHHRIA
jgi:GntR family transcriptional regulator/MocR family aminotransferase